MYIWPSRAIIIIAFTNNLLVITKSHNYRMQKFLRNKDQISSDNPNVLLKIWLIGTIFIHVFLDLESKVFKLGKINIFIHTYTISTFDLRKNLQIIFNNSLDSILDTFLWAQNMLRSICVRLSKILSRDILLYTTRPKMMRKIVTKTV